MILKALRGKSVWITGASSGIGLELALLAAQAGARLHLISSREEALKETARLCTAKGAQSTHYLSADLSQIPAASEAAEKLLNEHGPPDYLILNAGVTQRARCGETNIDVVQYIMNLNFLSSAAIARTVLPAMLRRNGGHIGVTSSLTGRFGFPLRSSYSASKCALYGFFETVGLEYAREGIHVTLVIPGRIRTPISKNSLDGQGRRRDVMDPGNAHGLDVQICALKYWKAVIKGRPEIAIGGLDKGMLFLHCFAPRLFRFIARRVNPY
ncbi:MAG: hypothetical protein B0D92_00090 [Spirochaeta sp. LUC14_002_19_P3]|nr:MAG: hypothetical protein B0D92_00090 [Spirochaeta sp. LUC14_002_19_P3]